MIISIPFPQVPKLPKTKKDQDRNEDITHLQGIDLFSRLSNVYILHHKSGIIVCKYRTQCTIFPLKMKNQGWSDREWFIAMGDFNQIIKLLWFDIHANQTLYVLKKSTKNSGNNHYPVIISSQMPNLHSDARVFISYLLTIM